MRRLFLHKLGRGNLPVLALPVLPLWVPITYWMYSTPASIHTLDVLTWMYLGASFSTNSAMGTSCSTPASIHTLDVLTWMYLGASFSTNSAMGTSCSTPASIHTLDVLTWMYLGASFSTNSAMGTSCSTPASIHTLDVLTWMYLGASFSTNSAMGTSLFHTCQYSHPRCTYLDVFRSLLVNKLSYGNLPVPHLPVFTPSMYLPGCI